MARPRNRAADYAVYLAVRTLVCVLQMFSHAALLRAAALLGRLAYRLDARHRAVAHDNLRVAFPDWTDARRDRAVRAVYRHFCTVAVEMILLPRKLHTANWRDYVALDGCEPIVAGCVGAGRPTMVVTGHLGNWEVSGYMLGLLGFKTYAIARELDNPHLDRFLRAFRQKTGQTVLAKKGDFTALQGVMASGGVVATLADQDAGPRGQFVPFFGRPASTHKAVALMALEYGATLVVVGSVKVGEPMRYRMVAADVIRPEEYAGLPDAVDAITRRFTRALEGLVRDHPEQYFWLHRRWKHQPRRAKTVRAA